MGSQQCYLTHNNGVSELISKNNGDKKKKNKLGRTTYMCKQEGKQKFGRRTILITEVHTQAQTKK